MESWRTRRKEQTLVAEKEPTLVARDKNRGLGKTPGDIKFNNKR